MAMAMSDSVTVSIAAEIAGTFIVMLRVRWVVVSTSDGMTSVSFGSSSTSSYARPSLEKIGGTGA